MPEKAIRELSSKTTRRIALPALLTILLFVTVIFIILLPQLEDSFLNRKKEMIRELTDTVWSLLEAYHEREVAGELSREDAQHRVEERIRKLRYGPEAKDYFWINDMEPKMIMHPYRPDLEGKNVANFTDSHGNHLFLQFVEMVRKHGAGYVDYMWQWKDEPGNIGAKTSYVRGFAPWGWIIGTGIYLRDVRSEIAALRRKLTLICIGILLLVSLLAIYSIRQTMIADQERLRIFLERESLMRSLKQSRERFRNLIETTSDWIWEIDSQGKITYASPRVKDLLGYSPEEAIDRTLIDFAPPGAIARNRSIYQQLVGRRQPFNGFEIDCRARDGRMVVLENNAVPIFDGAGEFLGFRGVARDISERRRAMEELEQSRDELHASLEETVSSLSSTVEKRDPYTAGHQQRVAMLACAIARELGLETERIEGLHIAALLHDIGKITLPSEYLAKPARLTSEEKAVVKCHPEVGHEILKTIHFPWPVADIVHQHHEHLDGSGYPQGLTDEHILLEAKILAVADVVEAMSSHRPYRPSLGIARALGEIREGRGSRYHGSSVDACIHLIEKKKIELCAEDWCEVFL